MNYHLFTDDTSLFYFHKNINVQEKVVNAGLSYISDCLVATSQVEMRTNQI